MLTSDNQLLAISQWYHLIWLLCWPHILPTEGNSKRYLGFKQTPQCMMVIGTFALFWKQTLKPFLFFHIFFSHKFELLDKVETGHCTHWNIGKVSLFFFCCCLFLRLIFIFTFFVTSVQEYFFFPIHINCHNNTKDIKKKPPHLLSFCDCEKVPLRGRVPIMHLVRWFMLLFSRLVGRTQIFM